MSLRIRPEDVTPTPGGASLSSGLQDESLVDRKGRKGLAAFIGTGRLKMIRQTYQPSGRHFPHHHRSTEQAYYLLAGKGRVRIGSEVFEATPGTMFYIPPMTEHEMENIGDVPLVNLLICVDLDEE